ncbi:MAG: ABC transporter permease subunit [Acaryochloridaceae cyanobacterium RL_2_7]|nr:ABC transporter permease subunit [Acaryochloridaceae cyanobacterium RL_2_7]
MVAIALLSSGGQFPIIFDIPTFDLDQGVQGGLKLTAEYSTLVIGLSLYTASFIAEIVRAGIEAVPKGQWEASKSLGLKPLQVMGYIIFPQALRVILPPLTSQYLNLAKNSSLAIAIGYPDIYAIASPTLNQTGRPIEVILILMAVYLTISLSLSLVMTLYSRSTRWGQA